jgi:hypothetical protein
MKWLILLLLFTSCGYRFEGNQAQVHTINIPYIKGDTEGQLTNALIREMSQSGLFEYVKDGGAYTLNVSLLSDTNEKIGFRYDRHDISGKPTKHLITTEGRRILKAEVSLIEESTLEEVIKPTVLSASEDYDYIGAHSLRDLSFINEEGKRTAVTTFSLGQLDSIEGAQDDVAVPLHRRLAQKIVDGIYTHLSQ